jgi:hypothetical protein
VESNRIIENNNKTHNKRAALVFLCAREVGHAAEHLDARRGVDEDRVLRWGAARKKKKDQHCELFLY